MTVTPINSFDGTRLHTFYVPAASGTTTPAPTILWVHGAFEYAERFVPHMQHFAQLGYQSIGFDLRGHGSSGGTRIYINSLDDYLKDVTAVYRHYQDKIDGKLFLLGHSMGGLIVTRHRQVYPKDLPVNNVAVTSPFYGIAVPIPGWKKVLSKIVVKIYPKLSLPNDLDPTQISTDQVEVQKYANDTMIIRTATAGWFEAILEGHRAVLADAPRMHGPFHILYGADDKVVDINATRTLYGSLPQEIDRSITPYPGMKHEILNEVERKLVYQRLEELFR